MTPVKDQTPSPSVTKEEQNNANSMTLPKRVPSKTAQRLEYDRLHEKIKVDINKFAAAGKLSLRDNFQARLKVVDKAKDREGDWRIANWDKLIWELKECEKVVQEKMKSLEYCSSEIEEDNTKNHDGEKV